MKRVAIAGALAFALATGALAQDRQGDVVYRQDCSACHDSSSIMVPSPKAGVARDWIARLEKGGLDGLTASAIQGVGAMPSRGGCEACTHAEIAAAIAYMLEGMQK